MQVAVAICTASRLNHLLLPSSYVATPIDSIYTQCACMPMRALHTSVPRVVATFIDIHKPFPGFSPTSLKQLGSYFVMKYQGQDEDICVFRADINSFIPFSGSMSSMQKKMSISFFLIVLKWNFSTVGDSIAPVIHSCAKKIKYGAYCLTLAASSNASHVS